jgi:3-dehydroquinate dehydratase-1
MRPIALQGRPLAGGLLPAVCVPLVGRTADALRAEARALAAAPPDLVEWRVDFFDGIGRADAVVDLAGELRRLAGVPLLFTRRSPREGGQPAMVPEAAVVALYRAVCAAGAADLVDWELEAPAADLAAVRAGAAAHGVPLLLSFHDFQRTPPAAELVARLRRMAQSGAAVGKVAVMPQSPADVLALLQATWEASQSLAIPVAGMSMGALGMSSRVCGGSFGSALTFAAGQAASAPGQVPLAALRAALAALRGDSVRPVA